MKKEIKKKWLRALRSGRYKQGKDYLHKNNKFCCLGVLCDLYAKEKKVKWRKKVFGECSIDYSTLYLPDTVQKWAGLEDGNPEIETDESVTSLSVLNDNKTPFREIANIIEKQL